MASAYADIGGSSKLADASFLLFYMNYADDKKEIPVDQAARESEFAENFTNAAREIYSTENRNPERAGCFSDEAILKMANSVKLPDESLINHLFDCSECFRQYRQSLESAKNPGVAAAQSGWRNIFDFSPLKIALVGAGLVLLIGFFSFRLFREKQSIELVKNPEVTNEAATSDNFIVPPDENNRTSGKDGEQPNDLKKRANTTAQKLPPKLEIKRPDNDNLPDEIAALNLVLGDNNTLRNAVNSSEKNIESGKLLLPARKVNLNIKLPKDFSGGRYEFRIIDAFGNTLLEQKTSLKNRRLLVMNLNLQTLENRANKLCLQKNDEMPDCFDIKVVK